jgi:methylated-DNA-[protein]-cysteine S-methyltransferase
MKLAAFALVEPELCGRMRVSMPCALFPTVFGTCGIAWNQIGLTAFQLPGVERDLAERDLRASFGEPPPPVQAVIDAACRHFRGDLQDFSAVALDWSQVSHFQRTVYIETQTIKAGFRRSYGDIARALALDRAAARAVGAALGANPWPLVVPCHRVVSSADKMTGFSAPGGVRTKTRLLALEGAELLSE